jgi:hypothetical protein
MMEHAVLDEGGGLPPCARAAPGPAIAADRTGVNVNVSGGRIRSNSADTLIFERAGRATIARRRFRSWADWRRAEERGWSPSVWAIRCQE